MNKRAVADGDIVADDRRHVFGAVPALTVQINDRAVLNVHPFADADMAAGVAADDGVVPDARSRADMDVADDGGGIGDEHVLGDGRRDAEIGFDRTGHGFLELVFD